MAQNTPLIELQNVSFAAQNKTIIKNISYALYEGQSIAFAGPSGGGKSTVLKLAAGLLVPTEGSVFFQGQDTALMNRTKNLDFRKKAAFVFQDSALWANQSIQQILELPLKIHFPEMKQTERIERIVTNLSKVGYKKAIDIRPAALSMGEQKLIAFARALICEPSVLFLDEWTESLDQKAGRRLIEIVQTMQNQGCTIIFVSHNIPIIRELAQQICIIEDGNLSQCVTSQEFAQDKSIVKTIQEGTAQ